MSLLYGLQSTRINRFLSGVNNLANRRQWTPPASCPLAPKLRAVNAYWGLNTVSHCHSVTLLPRNFLFCRTLNHKKSRCLSSAQSKELGVLTYRCTVRGDSVLRQGARKVAGVPALAASCSPSCPAVIEARSFRTSARVQAAPVPLLLLILKPVQKLLAIIVGRGIRKWWQALPPNKKELFKDSVRKNKWRLLLGLSAFGLLFVVFYFTHLEVSPVTGRSKLLLVGKEHFRLLSDLEYEVWMEEFKNDLLPERDPRYLTVKEMVYHLTQCNRDVPGISETNWVVHVVDSPAVNAFVLPNGQVFIFTGLLNSVTDVHQLSFLLGHEIAHAVLGHAAEKASLVHLLDFLGMIFLTMIWAICPRDSLAVLGQWIQSKLQEYMFDRPYSRTLEAEADKVGLQLAAKMPAWAVRQPVSPALLTFQLLLVCQDFAWCFGCAACSDSVKWLLLSSLAPLYKYLAGSRLREKELRGFWLLVQGHTVMVDTIQHRGRETRVQSGDVIYLIAYFVSSKTPDPCLPALRDRHCYILGFTNETRQKRS